MSTHTSLTNHDAATYSKHASFVYNSQFSSPILTLLDPQQGERIVDLGCGTGELTLVIKRKVGDGEVVGIDSSESMLSQARSNASSAGLDVTFLQGDMQHLSNSSPTSMDPSFQHSFDVVFSNAAIHWCKDSQGVMDSICWLLKPGGRLVVEFGGFGNTSGIRTAIHAVLRSKGVHPIPLDPWWFPTVEQYSKLISQHGLIPGNLTINPRPTPLPTDLYGWLETFARKTFFSAYDDAQASQFMLQVQEMCRADMYWSMENPGLGVVGKVSAATTKSKGNAEKEQSKTGEKEDGWSIPYVRLRATATKPKDA